MRLPEMRPPETYRERFAESGWRVLERAAKGARRRRQNYVSVEHLLCALADAEPELFDAVMRDLGVDARAVRDFIAKRLRAGLRHRGVGVRLAPEVNAYLKRAWRRAVSFKRRAVEASDLFIALAEDKRGFLAELLRGFGGDVEPLAWTVYRRVVEAEVARTNDLPGVYARFVRPPQPEPVYEAGDTVRIKSGPFASFTGRVEEVRPQESKLKVVVEVFGQPAAVELPFRAAEKVNFPRGH